MLAAIDGTGSYDWLKPDGSNSHVFRFYRDYVDSWEAKQYFPGPDTLGKLVPSIAGDVLKFIRGRLARGEKTIDLVGHSRGGHIAIIVAQQLGEADHATVRFLGLYDAVDRAAVGKVGLTGRIPDNVKFCAHARRSRLTLNRLWFGNTGTSGNQDRYVEEFFYGTHGAIGGDPFSGGYRNLTDQDIDAAAARRADAWMRSWANAEGISFTANEVKGSHVNRAAKAAH